MKPFTPQEAEKAKVVRELPEAVIRVFNELIAEDFDGGYATVYQEIAVAKIAEAMGCTEADVYSNLWVNVEDAYRARGWKVEYDRPIGWAGETFKAHWTFTKKRSRSGRKSL
jgi:hypothetical protein